MPSEQALSISGVAPKQTNPQQPRKFPHQELVKAQKYYANSSILQIFLSHYKNTFKTYLGVWATLGNTQGNLQALCLGIAPDDVSRPCGTGMKDGASCIQSMLSDTESSL